MVAERASGSWELGKPMDARQEGPKRDLPHWSALLNLSEAELAEHDVAAINLACAAGLPGAEHYEPHR